MADIVHIPSVTLFTGQFTEAVVKEFQEGLEELIVLELTNRASGQARMVVNDENGSLLATVTQVGPGAKRLNLQPLSSSISFFVECASGESRVDVVELRTATAVLPPGSSGSSIPEIDQIDQFIGRASGETDPVYGSAIIVTQNADLETAVGELDAFVGAGGAEDADQDSFMGRGTGETSPTYSSTTTVAQSSDLETAVGALDAEVGNGSSSLHRNNYVLVKAASDFPAASGGIRTLAAGVTYEINGSVDIGTDRLDASAAACIRGTCPDNDKLLTSNATSLISSITGLRISELTLENSSGPIFDIDGGGTSSFLARAFQIESSSAFGNIDNCTIISIRNWTIVATSDGITLGGTSGFVVINAVLSQSNLGTFTFLTIPAATTISGATMHDLAIDSAAGQTALNISPSATIVEKGVITSSAFTGSGTALTGITKGDVDWLFRSNRGILDSKIIGELTFIGNSAATVIASIGVFVDINATFSAGTLERFTQSGDELTYIGLENVEVQIIATVRFDPNGGDRTMGSRITVNGSQVGVVATTYAKAANSSSANPMAAVTLSSGDVISIQISNEFDTGNIIAQELLLTVLER